MRVFDHDNDDYVKLKLSENLCDNIIYRGNFCVAQFIYVVLQTSRLT